MAPRLMSWALQGLLRGASLTFCVGLAGASAAETIVGATFDGPTTRYGHGILGDAIEFTELVIETEDWSHKVRYRVSLPEDHVFEDIAPRLWDITGDGAPEVVVIETDTARGGSLAVYDETGKIGETPHIGRSNRWLAPIGAADFDGDGRIEVAFIDRPHLAKTLRVFEWDGTGLVLDAELGGLTNHQIGQDFISSGVRDCGDSPEMVTADSDWSDIMVTRMDGGVLETRSVAAFSSQRLQAVLNCSL
ncbi:Repeat domain-containing protein [Octadecabacter temperatus]|uniref:Uncharacterized protein n=1 Tax=Octadecabacter temperatus TaxID=1458307 RepID=A0A0K0Y3Y2_9RHOB|nr:VCBS repeat-containing protein [Octadecabacter temperatus]AKS45606.1 hypothetical protein OSB_10480 [Octadecabacter temperatus]SIN96703.1 Repeat domain-containing protein [Octadecabacter temperatus]